MNNGGKVPQQALMNIKFKKVLHLRSSGDLLGAENVVLEIAKNSALFGYQSIIGILRDSRDSEPDLYRMALNNCLMSKIFLCSGRIDNKCAQEIKRFVIANNISLLHCHGYKEDAYGILSRVSIPKVATNHLWKTNNMMLRFYRYLDAFLLKRFDRVVGVSDEIVVEMKRFGIKRPIKIQNGIDINKFSVVSKSEQLLCKYGLNRNGLVFGMVSSLTSEKNHILAIESLAKLSCKNAQLLIVGDGPLLTNLQERVACLGLNGRVFFVGRQRNISDILSIIDVFLIPSIKEGLPMALLEAMACGKAVIASDAGEMAKVIIDKLNGFIVKKNDKLSFVNAMQRFVDNNSIINSIGTEARNRVIEGFSSKNMVQKYCYLYDQVLANSYRCFS